MTKINRTVATEAQHLTPSVRGYTEELVVSQHFLYSVHCPSGILRTDLEKNGFCAAYAIVTLSLRDTHIRNFIFAILSGEWVRGEEEGRKTTVLGVNSTWLELRRI